jgi:hypothetical protein
VKTWFQNFLSNGLTCADTARHPGGVFLYCDVYVSPVGPSDPSEAAGTPDRPFPDIQSALNAALRGARVRDHDGESRFVGEAGISGARAAQSSHDVRAGVHGPGGGVGMTGSASGRLGLAYFTTLFCSKDTFNLMTASTTHITNLTPGSDHPIERSAPRREATTWPRRRGLAQLRRAQPRRRSRGLGRRRGGRAGNTFHHASLCKSKHRHSTDDSQCVPCNQSDTRDRFQPYVTTHSTDDSQYVPCDQSDTRE